MADDSLARLDSLSRGFRTRYLDYAELSAQLDAWAQAFPDLVRVDDIGATPEGRRLRLLTIGPDPERTRPAVWIDANMHAPEVCGSSVALAIAEDALRLHLAQPSQIPGLAAPVVESAREVLFYILPRMAPDGAEAVLKTGRYVRSVPRDHRPNRQHPRWIGGDVDGDGLALLMRVEDPGGEFVESPAHPGLMLPRRIEDPPPYYKIYPEGTIENFDGHSVPAPSMLSDNQTDLNRNFPWSWMPEPEQPGAGAYPTSEPESRAVVEFTAAHPNIFAWLNLHTFGGVFIRPLGHDRDRAMDPDDLALYRQLEAWASEHTGYPTVSGFDGFTYKPETPLRGDLTDYAYHQRGCLAWVVELWDLFEKLGLPRAPRFVDRYKQLDRDHMVRIARWDAEENAGRVLRPWNKCDHPQLGAVEVGGLDPRVGIVNPPYERIDEVCRGQSAVLMRVAALAPRLALAAEVEPAGGDVRRVHVTVENRGYLPSCGIPSARALPISEPLVATARADGCELLDPASARRDLGHLGGWGRGRFGAQLPFFLSRSQGNAGSRRVTYAVRGRGVLAVRAGSCRTGWIERRIEVA